MTLTLTSARKRARTHLQFGWFRRNAQSGYVFCPDCRVQVGAAWSAWSTAHESVALLREALAEHLRDCPARAS